MIIKRALDRKNTKVLTLMVWAIITILSLIPLQKLEIKAPSGTDKVVHIIMYFCLSTLFLWSYAYNRSQTVWIALSIILYGIVIELLQKYLPVNRSADIFDVVANTMGLLLGVSAQFILKRAEKKYCNSKIFNTFEKR